MEKHDLIVAAVPVADAAALYIAKQQGLFRSEGLNVKIETVVSGANAIAGQLSGKYDVVPGNYVSDILADAQQHDGFRVLAPAAVFSPNDSAVVVPALLTHQVDAAWMVEPFVTTAEMTGAQSLVDTDQGAAQDLPLAGYMATQSWERK